MGNLKNILIRELNNMNRGEMVKVEYGGVSLSFIIHDKTTPNSGLIIMDLLNSELLGDYDCLVELTEIYMDKTHRHRGVGRGAINQFCEVFKEYPIITLAGIHELEYGDEEDSDLSNGEIISILDSLGEFYEKCGFSNVDAFIGGYEMKRAYIYVGNKVGQFIVGKLLNENGVFHHTPKINHNRFMGRG